MSAIKHAARHGHDLRDGLGEAVLGELDADDPQHLLHRRVPGCLGERDAGDLLLNRGARDVRRKGRDGRGGAADAHHHAEERGELPEGLVVDLVRVLEERCPSVHVRDFLHDAEGVHVELGDVAGDGAEHCESAGDARGERHRRGLPGLELDHIGGDPVEHPGLDARSSRVLRDGPGDRGFADAALVQLCAKEVLPVDLHAAQAEDPEEELAGELLRLRLLGFRERVHHQGGVVHDIDIGVEDFLHGLLRLVLCHCPCSLIPAHSGCRSVNLRIFTGEDSGDAVSG